MNGSLIPTFFGGFGPSQFATNGTAPGVHRIDAPTARRLCFAVRQNCPPWPGVYGMLDADGQVIYVGKAKRLRTRLLSYFRPKSRDRKAARIIRHTGSIVWEKTLCEFGALLRELELIQRFRPRFNVQGQPWIERHYLCLGRAPAAYAFVSQKPKTAHRCYGPLPSGPRLHEAARRLNDWFQLRDCPQPQDMRFADQRGLFPMVQGAGCIRHDLGTCLAPCIGACTSRSYSAQVRAAERFLTGEDRSVLQRIEQLMQEAAACQAYERAATLRDQVETLTWLCQSLDRLRLIRTRLNGVYAARSYEGDRIWYVLRRGVVCRVLPAPISKMERERALRSIGSLYEARPPGERPITGREVDHVWLVAAWFRKHPEEWKRVVR
jgi:excinuclease ABC subunit C